MIVLLTPRVLMRTPTDIFQRLIFPLSVCLTFTLSSRRDEQRITGNVERGIATLVNDVEHTESRRQRRRR